MSNDGNMADLGELAFTEEDFGGDVIAVSYTARIQVAKVANRILAERLSRCPAVYSVSTIATAWWDKQKPENATHTARLVCVTPIARDTAEGLLREALAMYSPPEYTKERDWQERARKLLENK